ncbi:MAG: hypothetical protein K2I68_07865 [Bacteroidales bacterium]|nr:hypothetical protein [Bacteroidales bacterium]
MKKYSILLLLPAMALLLQGCKDKTEYCPCYPQEKTEYMPVNFVGNTMRYILDDDTLVLKVIPPEFSEKYAKDSEKALHDMGICRAQATLYLASADTAQVLTYRIINYAASEKYGLSVDFYDVMNRAHPAVWIEDIYHDAKNAVPLSQWTSPTGQTYTDVLQAVLSQTETDADTSYLSKAHGLLHCRTYNGHTFTLLP